LAIKFGEEESSSLAAEIPVQSSSALGLRRSKLM